jgi:hypothetical protein
MLGSYFTFDNCLFYMIYNFAEECYPKRAHLNPS